MTGRRTLLYVASALSIALLCVALAEVGIRLVVKTNPDTGMRLLGRVALLPYRPDPAHAEASWETAGRSTYIVRDADLGWAIQPNGGNGDWSATAHGFRGPKDWSTTPAVPAGKLRMSVYGDSFTHGDGSALPDTWPAQLGRLRPNLEVLNFGVPAYGTDQAYLRFRRDGRKFDAHVHILGIWPENLVRNLSVVRFYLNPHGSLGSSKPRFALGSGGLELLNSPVMSKEEFFDTVLQRAVAPVARRDHWYRPREQEFPLLYHLETARAAASVYNAYQRRDERNRLYFDREGEALKLAVAIAEAFCAEVRALGARPYVSVIPMRDFLAQHGSGAFPLPDMLRARSLPVLDFGPAFAAAAKRVGEQALYLPDGHLTAAGNRLVAEELSRALARDFPPPAP